LSRDRNDPFYLTVEEVASGTIINPTYLHGIPPIDKRDFPHFKPYLEESKLPKWAEDL